jgi:hypothetical protein
MILSALSHWLRFYFEEHASSPEDVPAEAERESIHFHLRRVRRRDLERHR